MNGEAIQGRTVVLLHGLARTSGSMAKMETALREAGFRTCNIGYPSTRFSVEVLASRYVVPEVCRIAENGCPIDFVTHSMGSIIVRQIRDIKPEIQFGRVVMLGPPNHGSEIVDQVRDWAIYRWLNGPAGQQLGTESDSVPNRLGPATFELGVIAGNKPFLEPFKKCIAGASDGKVSVESAKLQGMTDYRVMPVTHWHMTRNRQVIEQTIHFLNTGRFAGAEVPNQS